MMIREAVDDDFGVLVIRVWHESGRREAFRARLIYGGGDQDTAASALTTDPDQVLDAVRHWLDEQAHAG